MSLWENWDRSMFTYWNISGPVPILVARPSICDLFVWVAAFFTLICIHTCEVPWVNQMNLMGEGASLHASFVSLILSGKVQKSPSELSLVMYSDLPDFYGPLQVIPKAQPSGLKLFRVGKIMENWLKRINIKKSNPSVSLSNLHHFFQ